MSETRTKARVVRLKYPIKRRMSSMMSNFSQLLKNKADESFNMVTIEEVDIYRVRAKDLMGLDFQTPNTMNDNFATLISRSSNLTREEVEELDLADYQKIQEVVSKVLNA